MKRIAWAITGAGHFLAECIDMMKGCGKVDLFLSEAAGEVLRMYGVESEIKKIGARVYQDTQSLASAPIVARFSLGVYSVLLVAPATSNTVAKFVCGISDNLISNLFAQAGKSRVPIIVLPTDVAENTTSPGPKGGQVRVYPRVIDLENVEKLRGFQGVTVVKDTQELKESLEICLSRQAAGKGSEGYPKERMPLATRAPSMRTTEVYLRANNSLCTGCRACLLACSLHLFRENNPKKAALTIVSHFPEPGYFEVRTCTQCGECAVVCPVDSIPLNDRGAYYIDMKRCIACLACVDACPEGVIFTHPDLAEPFECDLCGECVEYCGTGALWIG